MRIALSTAALALVPVAETYRVQDRRERRLERRGRFLLSASAVSASSNLQSSQKPLWKQSGYRHVASAQPCDPSMAHSDDDEPDVGILTQCPKGYSCQPLSDGSDFGAFGGGFCVGAEDKDDDDDDAMTTRVQRQLQQTNMTNDCTYLEQNFYYDCDCSNWNNNVGSFECLYSYNTTYFGIPVATQNILSINFTEAQKHLDLQICYQALDAALSDGVEDFCITSYSTYLGNSTDPSNQTCAVTFNDESCDSCSTAKCNATDNSAYPDSFDCSNVNPDIVVEDVCGGNSIWKQLFAAEYPTTEPTGYPTYAPAMDSPTVASAPSIANSNEPTLGGASPGQPSASSGGDTPTADGGSTNASSAWSTLPSWRSMPLLLTSLVSLGVGLN